MSINQAVAGGTVSIATLEGNKLDGADGMGFPALAGIRHVALDMDGTIYKGGTLFDFTLPFLALLDQLGIGYTFLTNNSSKSTEEYLARLRAIGVPARADSLYTSSMATITWLKRELPNVSKVFVLGTSGHRDEMRAAGFIVTEDSASDEPDAVVVGFDTDLAYSRLCRAAYWIQQGKPFIATHPDLVCPTDEPTVLVDCGAICAALEKAAGRAPDMVLGKPEPCMLEGILRMHNLEPRQLAMVGDRLYTDIAMATRVGALGVLVLTGETTAARAASHQPPPGLIIESLKELGQSLLAARNRSGEL